MNKKAMGIGQVFIFIMAAITFSLIMIFGYKAIGSFLKSGEDVAFVQFKTDMESSIRKIYTEYDSVREKKFYLPGGYDRICFVDFEYNPDSNPQRVEAEINELCEIDPIACGAWREVLNEEPLYRHSATAENVFLKPPAPVKLKTHKVSVYDSDGMSKIKGFHCQKILNGNFAVTLIGKGDRTGIIGE